MRVRIIGERLVAPDGHHVQTWPDGSIHDVADWHGDALIRDGWAVPADGPAATKVVAPAETKDDEPSNGKRKKG